MHVEFTRNGNRHFVCTSDGARVRESKENRILRPGRPLKGSPRPKRIRNEKPAAVDTGVRTHRIL